MRPPAKPPLPGKLAPDAATSASGADLHDWIVIIGIVALFVWAIVGIVVGPF